MTTLIILNEEEMSDLMKMIKSLKESGLLVNGVSETIKNQAKERGGFLRMLLGRLGASLLVNLLAGKGVIPAGEGTVRAGGRTIRTGQNF